MSVIVRQIIVENLNEEQTSRTDASRDVSDFQANRESNLSPFIGIVSFGDFRNYGTRTAHRNSLEAALLSGKMASSFGATRAPSLKPPRKNQFLCADDNRCQT